MHNVLFCYSFLVLSVMSKAWFGQFFTYSRPPHSIPLYRLPIPVPPSLSGNPLVMIVRELLSFLPLASISNFPRLSLVTSPLLRSLSCLFFPSLGNHTDPDFFPSVCPLSLPTLPSPSQFLPVISKHLEVYSTWAPSNNTWQGLRNTAYQETYSHSFPKIQKDQ